MDRLLKAANLEAALGLVHAGLPILPATATCNPRSGLWTKKPCISGWKERAITDEDNVRAHWKRYPHAVPGIALGLAKLVVIDADRHGGPDGVQALQELIDRYGLPDGVVRTITPGHGEHYYFRNLAEEPLGNSEGALPAGINMRGHGGFIIAPGAFRPDGAPWREKEGSPHLTKAFIGGTIPEVPIWLVELIRPKRRGTTAAFDGKTTPSRLFAREQAYAEQALRNACNEVASATRGKRNDQLNSAAFQLGRIVAAGWISADLVRSALFDAAVRCGHVRDDGEKPARATIESGLRGGSASPQPPLPNRTSGTIGTFGTATHELSDSEWAEPDLSSLGSGRSTPPHFPVDTLGPFWGPWCKAHAEARCVPVDYVAAGLLGGAAALIGNARQVLASPEWKEPTVLWLSAVGDPSAGKGPALDPCTEMLRTLEQEAIEATRQERLDHEELVQKARAAKEHWQQQVKTAVQRDEPPPPRPSDALEPEPISMPRVLVGDTTPEALAVLLKVNPKGLLLHRDELAGWFGSFGRYSASGNGEREFWIEAYGGRPYTIDRKNSPEPVIIPRLSVSVLGGIQPEKLALITGGFNDGFAARYLWFWPERVTSFRLQRQCVGNSDQLTALRSLQLLPMSRTEEGLLEPNFVPLAEAAATLFESYTAELKARDVYGPMQGTLGKAPGHVLRLALTREYLAWSQASGLRPEPEEISKEAMEDAIYLVEHYFLLMAQRVFGEAAIPEQDRLGMELARWIGQERPQRFNARTTRRKINRGLREPKAMKIACEALTEANWIRPLEKPGGPGMGRPPTEFVVNPILLRRLETE
ncbi:DUF3987 domain-containing protein [Microvirga arabica]|uniref:DUF3987 domain-containing protein n=1 Tax=Microvirga arabica TaxID=1128671 RepID=UPI001939F2F8|nr:DUF3987 domain-containing protein [Microvirga arabica]MBM1171267.1 DUF3987 domain-containing protein [Microvirga arabica]